MFSAIYLVCFMGEPCQAFVDQPLYTTLEECNKGAESNISRNNAIIHDLGQALPSVEFQCINWEKA